MIVVKRRHAKDPSGYRWYVMIRSATGCKTQRLSTYLAKARAAKRHRQVAAVLAAAIAKGYKL